MLGLGVEVEGVPRARPVAAELALVRLSARVRVHVVLQQVLVVRVQPAEPALEQQLWVQLNTWNAQKGTEKRIFRGVQPINYKCECVS